jgi:hypothetical protein
MPLPDRRTVLVAAAALALVLSAAFAGAWWTRDLPLFSLVPAGASAADMLPGQRLDLHRTFFTAWAAVALVTPALCLAIHRASSAHGAERWLAMWTAAWLAFVVHYGWAVEVIFGGDWQRILHTPRVSAPLLGTVFVLWWTADVLLAWTLRREPAWIKVERGLLHLLAFVMFFVGAAREGELPLSRAIGWAMAIAVMAAVVLRLVAGRRRETPRSPAT